MSVTPMISELVLKGAGSTGHIEIGNDTNVALPFESTITQIDWDEQGQQHETPADKDFLVFPPQGVVPAHSRQAVRVQWLGDPLLKSSRSYYLTIRQIPVPLDMPPSTGGATMGVQVVYKIKALITVAPKGAKTNISVVSSEAVMAPPPRSRFSVDSSLGGRPPPPQADVPAVRVVLKNTGNRHALMGGVNWMFDGVGADGKPLHVTLLRDKIIGAIGIGYLPPDGGQRVFIVPVEQPFYGHVKVRFTE